MSFDKFLGLINVGAITILRLEMNKQNTFYSHLLQEVYLPNDDLFEGGKIYFKGQYCEAHSCASLLQQCCRKAKYNVYTEIYIQYIHIQKPAAGVCLKLGNGYILTL